MAHTTLTNYFTFFTLEGVKGQMNVMIVHDTMLNGHAPIYQISLTYLERQKSYSPEKFCQLFDLRVKVQGQMNVMMVCDTPSNGDAHI